MSRLLALVFLAVIALTGTIVVDEGLTSAESGNLTANQTDTLGHLFGSGFDVIGVLLLAIAAFATLAALRSFAP